MSEQLERSLLSETEEVLKARFDREEASKRRVPSTARDAASSDRVDQLVLPDEMRAKMPFTKDKYLVKENPQLVAWEREVRKFLRQLSPQHGHRVAAVMVYEWATGLNLQEVMEEEKNFREDPERKFDPRPSWRAVRRRIAAPARGDAAATRPHRRRRAR